MKKKHKSIQEEYQGRKKYMCIGCDTYFENGDSIVRFCFTHYVGCKKYECEMSRYEECVKNRNYEDIIKSGGRIGSIPSIQSWSLTNPSFAW